VSFNIEIFDEKLSKLMMPGKGDIPRESYFESLRAAVRIFGEGNVRSIIVIGFDSMDSLTSGVERLCSIGVQPVLSIFRPISGTPLDMSAPPEFSFIKEAYLRCQKYAKNLECA